MTQPATDSRAAIREFLGSGPIAYYRAFAAIGGGVTAGVLLSQLFYWHDKARDPDGWIFKTQAEWQAETGLTRREQETARRKLRQRGILHEKLAGIPARLHYRLDVDRVVALLADQRRARLAAAAGDDRQERLDVRDGRDRASASEGREGGAPAVPDRRDAPDRVGGERQTGMAESAAPARHNPPDQPAQIRQPRLAESAKQARRKPPDKPARIRQSSVAESASHAETTREYARESPRDHDTASSKEKAAAASPMRAICSVHHVTMHLRQKDGDVWYSHQLPDGTWCRGAPGDQPSSEPDPQSWEGRRRYALQFAGMGIALPGLTPEEVHGPPRRSGDERSRASPRHR